MDIALAIELLVPAAKYGGSVTANTREAFDAIRWEDQRTKPTWAALQSVIIPVPVPSAITRRQGRRQLIEEGKLAEVESFIAAIEDSTERAIAQVEYEAETWERSNAWVSMLGQLLGYDEEGIDQLFIAASTK